MASNTGLKFQFHPRFSEIIPQLIAGGQQDIAQVTRVLEERDKELEDYLNNIQGGGGTAQSIIAVAANSANQDDDSATHLSGQYTDLTFDVPADTSFNYYLEWDINGIANCDYTYPMSFKMYAQIYGQSPGAGFENWGFNVAQGTQTNLDWNDGGRQYLSGHGHRVEAIDSSNYGTTITLQVYWEIETHYATRIRHVSTYGAKLIAIPA